MSFFKTAHIRFVMIFVLGVLSFNAYSVYKWKDADGNIQYTEYPPPTGEVEIIKLPPISTVGAQKSEQPADKDDEVAPKAAEQKTIPPDPKEKQARKEKNCETAKKNLATYMRTKKVRDKEGNVVRIDDDDWQRRVDETRKKIEEFCN